ncbi:MAG: cytidine deaminase [Porphyromonadaceae bacterium]|nr:cytidine deaminase [Porphyromonadaceae bacterium]
MNILTNEFKYTEYKTSEIPEKYTEIIEEAKSQTKNAYAEYSNFRVGAAVLLKNGIIIGGNNQENAAFPSGLCAERTAVFYANSQYPDVPVKTIAIAAFTNGDFLKDPISPCGGCRQVLLETENRFGKDIEFIMYGTEKTYILSNVRSLLPFSFGKENLEK